MEIHENFMEFLFFLFRFPEHFSGKDISSRQIGPDKYLKVTFDFQFSIPTNAKKWTVKYRQGLSFPSDSYCTLQKVL